jgi:mannosyl-3-phosphoglycerate phosphatase
LTQKRLIVISDLDGTLLDQQTYQYEVCLLTIQKLLSLKIPLILCSSKTRSEILPLWEELGLHDPFVVENGGAIYFPVGYFPFSVEGAKPREAFEALEFGMDISMLRQALTEAARQCNVKVSSFGTMDLNEISTLTGLPRDQALLAGMREYDEPFVLEEQDRDEICAFLTAKGLKVIEGDRFSHLTGGNDKGRAVQLLLDLYRRSGLLELSVGLGNSANDLAFLREVDWPVAIRNPNGTWDAELLSAIPNIRKSHGIGPYGWREAVEDILASV